MCQILWNATYPAYLQMSFFFFQNFHLFSFSLTWDLRRAVREQTFQNATPPVFIQAGPNVMTNTAVIGEYKVMDVLAICQKNKKKIVAL